MKEWKVNRPAAQCRACEKNLDDETFHSALRDNGMEFERLDYCAQCWESGEIGKEDLFSFWRTRHIKEDETRPAMRIIGTDTLLNIFHRLVKDPGGKGVFLYLLTVVLMQKRSLRYIGTESRAGTEFMSVRAVGGADPILVPIPAVTPAELEQAQQNFRDLLDTEA